MSESTTTSPKFNCSMFIHSLAKKVTEMSGIKFSKLNTPGVSKSGTKSSMATTTTIGSSINPNCAYVVRQKYMRARRLITRHDIRSRMSIWVNVLRWCRGGNKKEDREDEKLFTLRS